MEFDNFGNLRLTAQTGPNLIRNSENSMLDD